MGLSAPSPPTGEEENLPDGDDLPAAVTRVLRYGPVTLDDEDCGVLGCERVGV